MTTQTLTRADVRGALVWGGFLSVLWIGVALLRPGTTFHLAPLLVAAAPPLLLSLNERSAVDARTVTMVGATSAAMAAGTALIVAGIGAMEGPAFEPFPTPMIEALVLTVAGAAIGVGFGRFRARRSTPGGV